MILIVKQVMSTQFLHDIEVSRAVRDFSSDRSVDINPILETIRLAPTAWGIQPFKVHVVSSTDTKKELFQTSCSHSQVIEHE
jgi:nitroreductase